MDTIQSFDQDKMMSSLKSKTNFSPKPSENKKYEKDSSFEVFLKESKNIPSKDQSTNKVPQKENYSEEEEEKFSLEIPLEVLNISRSDIKMDRTFIEDLEENQESTPDFDQDFDLENKLEDKPFLQKSSSNLLKEDFYKNPLLDDLEGLSEADLSEQSLNSLKQQSDSHKQHVNQRSPEILNSIQGEKYSENVAKERSLETDSKKILNRAQEQTSSDKIRQEAKHSERSEEESLSKTENFPQEKKTQKSNALNQLFEISAFTAEQNEKFQELQLDKNTMTFQEGLINLSTQMKSETQELGAKNLTMPLSPVQQVEMEIRHAVQEGIHELEFDLNPLDLGKMNVRLNIDEEGQVRALIQTEKLETLELFQQDSTTREVILKAFEEAGLTADSNSLQFTHQETSSHQEAEAFLSIHSQGNSSLISEEETLSGIYEKRIDSSRAYDILA